MDIIVTLHQRDFRTREWVENDTVIGNFERFAQWVEDRVMEFREWEHPNTKFELLEDRAVVMLLSRDGVEYLYQILEPDTGDIPEVFARLRELAEHHNLPIGEIKTLRDEPWFVALYGQPV